MVRCLPGRTAGHLPATEGLPAAHVRLLQPNCRPLTLEVAGSSPVAPAANTLQIGKAAARSGVCDRRLSANPAFIPHGTQRARLQVFSIGRPPTTSIQLAATLPRDGITTHSVTIEFALLPRVAKHSKPAHDAPAELAAPPRTRMATYIPVATRPARRA